jgi:proteasome lid subunit RPN8/RPN11
MEMYCDLSEGEIGWLGFVEKYEGVGFLITDCILLKQEVHATTTEIDPMALIEFWNQTPPEQQSKIKIWGHSHVNMSTTPSGQDDSQMEYFKDGNKWFIRLITNKKREYHIDVYDYENGLKVHMDQSDLKTYNPAEKELRDQIKAEINEKVSKKEYKSYTAPKKDDKEDEEKNGTKKLLDSLPMLKDITVRHVRDFDEVINDPNYWQFAGYAQ